MINLLITGHEYNHDLFELVRTFFPNKEIKYINSREEYLELGYLIESRLIESNNLIAITNIYKNGDLLIETKEDIENINIASYNKKQKIKIGIKKSLYDSLLELIDNDIPWGILTGIRPTKVVHNLFEKKLGYDEIFNILTTHYRLSSSKANLLLDINLKQQRYLYPLDNKKYSIYISIPFCPTRCFYCSFPALPIDRYDDFVKVYVDKLIFEIEESKKFMYDKNINTVYIGGGTPTAISEKYLDKIIGTVFKTYGEGIKEFTVEAGRPDTINLQMLKMLKANNIDRISINPQTMVDKTLKLIGRNHSSKDIINSFNLAREIGFDNINMDLILGLPGEGIMEIKETLREIAKLNPENLTVHSLAIKRGSKYKNDLNLLNLDQEVYIEEMTKEIHLFTENMDLWPYYLYRQKQIAGNLENIGYSKVNRECIYNISMMEEKETILGFGMGAVSKIFNLESNKIKRVPNFKGLKDYINRIDELIDNKRESIIKNY